MTIKVILVAHTQWTPNYEIYWNPDIPFIGGVAGDKCLASEYADVKIFKDDPEHITATGKRICRSKQPLEEIKSEKDKIDIRNIASLKTGHMGVFEHIYFTFLIEGISRNETHQHVRHRLASYLQMSQRAVPMDHLELIVPESIPKEERTAWFLHLQEAFHLYNRSIEKGAPLDDARYIMPHGMETRLWMTTNARNLMHFFKERFLNTAAHWEIKEVAKQMHALVKEVCPTIFDLKYKRFWEPRDMLNDKEVRAILEGVEYLEGAGLLTGSLYRLAVFLQREYFPDEEEPFWIEEASWIGEEDLK